MDLPQLVKRLAGLCGLVVAFFVVYMITRIPHRRDPFFRKTALAERITIQQGPRRIDFYREGKGWAVSVSTGLRLAAEDNRVTALASGLEHVQVEDEISDRSERHADFDVTAASGVQVSLYDKENKRLAEGLFGKQAPDFNRIYFRYPDRPNVYLARGLIRGELGEADLGRWRRKLLINLPEAQIRAIRIDGPGHQAEILRSSDTWMLNGKPMDPAPAHALVGALAHLQADDFADDVPLSFDQLAWATIHIEGEGQTVDLRIGPKDASMKRYPVSTGPQAGIAWISESKIQPLLMKQGRPSK